MPTDQTLQRDPDGVDPVAAERPKHTPVWLESVVLLGFALVLAIVIKGLFLQAFYIPSESMEPGLIKNDRILVEKPSYWFGGPSRGDVVVFKDPGGWLSEAESAGPSGGLSSVMAKVGLYPAGGHLVKRVIAVAGDTVECCDTQGRILVNTVPLDESDYARPGASACGNVGPGECYGPMPQVRHWTAGPVPDGKLFVMGDNRNESADSSAHLCLRHNARSWCTESPWVDEDLVVGKVVALAWPASRLDWIGRPDTFDSVPDPQ
ncbi:MAG: signal peptidase I [Nocardioides sp.]